ncbi:MAG: PRD domain-containing protein [Treponema sp.]|jgi:transcriptional regulatory protein LevR|nr:PRD domain-containing protein [Treponema sp.]
MDLNGRLDILLSSRTISPEVDATVRRVIERMADPWGLTLTEENGSRLVTHLAMALMRISRGEIVESMDRESLEEFKASVSFPQAMVIASDIISFAKLTIPESEREYLDANICLILEAEDK